MTRDEIMEMAKKAGWGEIYAEPIMKTSMLEKGFLRFAALVAAAEREACAQVCEETTAAWTQPVYNEACMECAKAIRARGEK